MTLVTATRDTIARAHHAHTRARDTWTRAVNVARHADTLTALPAVTLTSAAAAVAPGTTTITAYTAAVALTALNHKRVTRHVTSVPAWWSITHDWNDACAAAGLDDHVTSLGITRRPRLTSLRRDTDGTVTITVKPLPGQEPHDYEDDAFRRQLHARRVTATRDGKRIIVTLHPTRQRPAKTVTTTRTPTTLPNLEALPVARDTDTGEPATVPLLGAHLLLVGATRAGKSGAIWAINQQIAPGIRDGLVRVHAVDPKGGMELGIGEPLYATFLCDDGTAPFGPRVAAFLDGIRRSMDARAARLRRMGKRKLDAPTHDMPLEVILIDEVLALMSILDKKSAYLIDACLKSILAKGAAIGYCVITATQDPRKDSGLSAIRDLSPVRVLLRVKEQQHVDLVMGYGARDAGCDAHKLDFSRDRGVAFVEREGEPGYRKVRFNLVTDEMIASLVRDFAPSRGVPGGTVTEPVTSVVDTAELPVVEAPEPVSPVTVYEDAPGEPPLVVVPRVEAWEGGPKRGRDEALALLDALVAEGRPVPTGASLGEWAGRTDRWGRGVLATWRDRNGKTEAAGSCDRPLAAEPTVPDGSGATFPARSVSGTLDGPTGPEHADPCPGVVTEWAARPENGDQQ
ncbi:type IV secretory system conjugative DNA transfer family protein [Arsenicicoccus dermatophilus]|uniref:type IV secretory system conjugative DNA transfer family protein n=1 Tax=Arsenicicoccus dermatophilus TaxID=1076331 RepID=UPI001F4CCC48|nr:hypothetical protein [Arsenicicoccus dermatophilus]MCH8613448.1 hypothetical protein [Arsenicicoccus dermatophilus]